MYVRPLPIPPASDGDKARLSELAEGCAAAAQRGDDETLAVHEAEIDQIVYRLFNLTDDEIALIESSLAPTREKKPAKRSKVVRTVPYAESEGTPAFPRAKPTFETPHTECADHSPAKPFLEDQLFTLEGELTAPAKKPTAGPKPARSSKSDAAQRLPATAIEDIPRPDVLATVRDLFSSGESRDRETALRDLAQALGYERLGKKIREVLSNDLLTAVRRSIVRNDGGDYTLDCRHITDYDRAFLKDQFLAAISHDGRVWHDRDDAIRLFTRWLGYRRTGKNIDKIARSLINGLLRESRLEADGDRIRRA